MTNSSSKAAGLRSTDLRAPRVPALLSALGSELSRRQPDGELVRFRSVKVRTDFTNVYSRLDGYSSTWHTLHRRWVPVDALIDGQLQLIRVV